MADATPRHTLYLALGSNLGDRRANLAAAVARMAPLVAVERISQLYETEPAYVTDQPRFLNAVLRGTTTLPPEELLGWIKRLEPELGRREGLRFGPRLIDIDILLYDELTLTSPALTIPHPRMAERPFVLVPLAELAPTLIPPGWSASVADTARLTHTHGEIIAPVGQLAIYD